MDKITLHRSIITNIIKISALEMYTFYFRSYFRYCMSGTLISLLINFWDELTYFKPISLDFDKD